MTTIPDLPRIVPRPVDRVSDAELVRLLGYPPGHELAGDVRDLAITARRWAAAHARAWCGVILLEPTGITEDEVRWERGSGTGSGVFRSAALATRLARAGAAHLILVAASAGRELDREAARLVGAGLLVEAHFLDRVGAAWAEELLRGAALDLRAGLAPAGLFPLAPLGPGHEDWDVREQARFLSAWGAASAGPLECEDSGLLRPRYSITAAIGLTRRADAPGVLSDAVSCRACSWNPCAVRRTPGFPGTRRTIDATPR